MRIARLVVVSMLVMLGACGDDGGELQPDAPMADAAAPDSPPADAAIDAPDSPETRTVTSVSLDVDAFSLADGLTRTLVATASYSDGSMGDVSDVALWTSSTPATGTISVSGVVTAVAPGTSTITVLVEGQTDTATLTVTAAAVTAIAVTPDASMLCAGDTQTLVATATYTDGTMGAVTPTWSSTPLTTATISAAGVVTGVAAGTATITASVTEGATTVTDTATVIVTAACLDSIVVSGAATLTVGTTTDLTATGMFSDGSSTNITSMVTWTAAPEAIATVSDTAGTKGRVTGVAAGTASITATSGAVSDDFSITVNAATITSISLTPETASILSTATQQLTVTATFNNGSMANVTGAATYTAAPTGRVTISSGGLVTPVAGQTGTTTITAMAGGATDTMLLTVTAPAAAAIAISGPNGPLTPGGTEVGGDHVAGSAYTRMYTIMNTGTATLMGISVTFPSTAAPVNCTQTLMAAPGAVVPTGGSTTFTISTTHPATGTANCPFIVASTASNAPSFRNDRGANATPAITMTKNALAACGARTVSGFTVGLVNGSLNTFTSDGTTPYMVQTIGNCTVQKRIAPGSGGTTVSNAADMVSCQGTSTLNCTESMGVCSGSSFGSAPFAPGGTATLTLTDSLLGAPASHSFAIAPGVVNTTAIAATQSRAQPLTYSISGGPASTFVYTTISQGANNDDVVASCETAGNASSVSIPAAVLASFVNGAFTVTISHQTQAYATQNGYNVTFLLIGDLTGPGAEATGQTGTFTN